MSRRTEIGRFTDSKIKYIAATANQGEGKAILANLRRGAGKAPGEAPEILGFLLTEMPEDFLSKGTSATREEWACYIALTLYALHQQGNDPVIAPMNTDKYCSIGAALSALAAAYDDRNAKSRLAVKLQALSSSKDMSELAYHLRSDIKLLKTKGIPLNYPQLAEELYDYQFAERRSGIFLRWAQDFYRTTSNSAKTTKEKDNG